ncbi:unnamed protein product [Owenia fusiformis]|uniref:Uncharacterized protein n=1 Tax=Owenia fusiformis TaxID=6347 RepID=A0A8J1TFW3_OWEFU|nr:unnamed protein product [Owenia fusiformis]
MSDENDKEDAAIAEKDDSVPTIQPNSCDVLNREQNIQKRWLEDDDIIIGDDVEESSNCYGRRTDQDVSGDDHTDVSTCDPAVETSKLKAQRYMKPHNIETQSNSAFLIPGGHMTDINLDDVSRSLHGSPTLLKDLGYTSTMSDLPVWKPSCEAQSPNPNAAFRFSKKDSDQLGNAIQLQINSYRDANDNLGDELKDYVIDHEVMSVLNTVSVESCDLVSKTDINQKFKDTPQTPTQAETVTSKQVNDVIDVNFINDLVKLGALSDSKLASPNVPFPNANAIDQESEMEINIESFNIDDQDLIHELPQLIILKIFSFFSHSELCHKIMHVCKAWYCLAHDPLLWQHISITSDKDLDNGTILRLMKRSPQLKKLTMWGRNELNQTLVSSFIRYTPKLKTLILEFCHNVNSNMLRIFIKNCSKISELNLEGCDQIDANCVNMITDLQYICKLNLSHCVKLTEDDIVTLVHAAEPNQFVEFNIDGISCITDSVLEQLVLHHQSSLTSLTIDGAEISDESMAHISNCENMRKFSISFAELLTDKSLIYLKRLQSLTELRLKKGIGFSTEVLQDFFESHQLNLEYLDLTECTFLQDSAVFQITKQCGKTLRSLALCWCWDLTDDSLISIVDNCPNIRHLDLTGLDKITGSCLDRIPEEMPHLKFLDLRQCNNIIDELIQDVVRRKKDLTVINYYGEEFSVFGNTLYVSY